MSGYCDVEAGMWRISLEDQGPGWPPNYVNESSSVFFVSPPRRTRKRAAAAWDLPFAGASLHFTAAAFGRTLRRGRRVCALFSPFQRWSDRARRGWSESSFKVQRASLIMRRLLIRIIAWVHTHAVHDGRTAARETHVDAKLGCLRLVGARRRDRWHGSQAAAGKWRCVSL